MFQDAQTINFLIMTFVISIVSVPCLLAAYGLCCVFHKEEKK